MQPYALSRHRTHGVFSSLQAGVVDPKSVASDKPTERTDTPFLTTGWEPDRFLNHLYKIGAIDAKGALVIDRIDLNEFMAEELKGVLPRLEIEGDLAREGSTCNHRITLKEAIDRFRNQMATYPKAPNLKIPFSDPEIIGGAVAFLLTPQFYISYLVRRFEIDPDNAEELIRPFLEMIRKTPNDYDIRIWGENIWFVENQNSFREHAAQSIFKICSKSNPREIKNSFFSKLFATITDNLRYAIAGFGEFNGAPVEFIFMEKTDRPYLLTRDRVALQLESAPTPLEPKRVVLKFIFRQLPNEKRPIAQETFLIHQMGMILDTTSFKGINYRGWLIGMILSSKGWRTLKTDFFLHLWSSFEDQLVVSGKVVIATLDQELDWAEKNHLSLGETGQKIALRLNLVRTLIQDNRLTEEDANELLGSIDSIEQTNPRISVFFRFRDQRLSVQEAFDWHLVAIYLDSLDRGISTGMVSIQYGKPCFRLLVNGSSTAVFWVPIEVEVAFQTVIRTVSSGRVATLLEFLDQWKTDTVQRLDHLKEILPKELVLELIGKLHSHKNLKSWLLAIKLEILLLAYEKINKISNRSIENIPKLLDQYPILYSQLKSITTLPPLETIRSPILWMIHCIKNESDYGLKQFQALSQKDKESFQREFAIVEPEDGYLRLYSKHHQISGMFDQAVVNRLIYKRVKQYGPPVLKKLTDEEGVRYLPWALLWIMTKGKSEEVTLERKSGATYNLTFGQQNLSISIPLGTVVKESAKEISAPEILNELLDLVQPPNNPKESRNLIETIPNVFKKMVTQQTSPQTIIELTKVRTSKKVERIRRDQFRSISERFLVKIKEIKGFFTNKIVVERPSKDSSVFPPFFKVVYFNIALESFSTAFFAIFSIDFRHYSEKLKMRHPVEALCIGGINLHKVILNTGQGNPSALFCDPKMSENYLPLLYKKISVYAIGFMSLSFVGISSRYRFTPVRSEKTRIAAFLSKYREPIVALGIAAAVFYIISVLDEQPLEESEQFIDHCHNYTEAYFRSRLEKALPNSTVDQQLVSSLLQDHICNMDYNIKNRYLYSLQGFMEIFSVGSLLAEEMILSLPRKLRGEVNQHTGLEYSQRKFLQISAYIKSALLFGASHYYAYESFAELNDKCYLKYSTFQIVLQKDIDDHFCDIVDEENLIYNTAKTVIFHISLIFSAYLFGRQYVTLRPLGLNIFKSIISENISKLMIFIYLFPFFVDRFYDIFDFKLYDAETLAETARERIFKEYHETITSLPMDQNQIDESHLNTFHLFTRNTYWWKLINTTAFLSIMFMFLAGALSENYRTRKPKHN